MDADLLTDEERAKWEAIWRNRPLRQLVDPIQIDVVPTSEGEWGEVTRVEIAADPAQFADQVWRKTEICPMCGKTTSKDCRVAVTVYPYFASGFSYGFGAWAHPSCFEACKEIGGPAPVPW